MLNFLMVVPQDNIVKRPIDDILIQNIAKGDMDAFHELYENAKDGVYAFALSITKNTFEAEDVLQETFINVYRTAPNYEPCGKPMAWILTIAKNCSFSRLRQLSKTEELDDTRELVIDSNSLEVTVENKELLEKLFSELSAEEREIITLHAVGGLKHREIASVLELPVGTVLSKYNRAIKKLRIIMKGEMYNE